MSIEAPEGAAPLSRQHDDQSPAEDKEGTDDDVEGSLTKRESELINIRSFTTEGFIEDVLSCAREEGDDGKELPKSEFAARLRYLFEQRYPELNALETLQRIEHAVVRQPKKSLKTSGMKYDAYLRDHFSQSIARGFLPVSEIGDPALRKRISVEKSRSNFPSDLSDICLTQNEVARLKRQVVTVLIGLGAVSGARLARFARSLISFDYR